MKVNLNYSNSSIKNLSLQDTFKVIIKKKVIIQKGYKPVTLIKQKHKLLIQTER